MFAPVAVKKSAHLCSVGWVLATPRNSETWPDADATHSSDDLQGISWIHIYVYVMYIYILYYIILYIYVICCIYIMYNNNENEYKI
jgi:hypothetical protein